MKKIIPLAAAILLGVFLSACSHRYTPDNMVSSPRTMTGILKYNGAVFSPISFLATYKYSLYSINGDFIGYVDNTSIPATGMDSLLNKLVVVRGVARYEDGDVVIKAQNLDISR